MERLKYILPLDFAKYLSYLQVQKKPAKMLCLDQISGRRKFVLNLLFKMLSALLAKIFSK